MSIAYPPDREQSTFDLNGLMDKVQTIGYRSGLDKIEQIMQANSSTLLVDIRHSPRSSNPEWTRTAFSKKYQERYIWIKALGNINHKEPGNIQIEDLDAGLDQLIAILQEHKALLMCGCTEYEQCHRRVVYEALRARIHADMENIPGNNLTEQAKEDACPIEEQPQEPATLEQAPLLGEQEMNGLFTVIDDTDPSNKKIAIAARKEPPPAPTYDCGTCGAHNWIYKGYRYRCASCNPKLIKKNTVLPQSDNTEKTQAEPIDTIKCLSIRQPYASWLCNPDLFTQAGIEPKTIENRDWSTQFRGDFLIHASNTFEDDAIDHWSSIFPQLKKIVPIDPAHYPKGVILGRARLIDVVQRSNSEWFCGDYGFVLADAKQLEHPVPYRGQLGFFNVSLSTIDNTQKTIPPQFPTHENAEEEGAEFPTHEKPTSILWEDDPTENSKARQKEKLPSSKELIKRIHILENRLGSIASRYPHIAEQYPEHFVPSSLIMQLDTKDVEATCFSSEQSEHQRIALLALKSELDRPHQSYADRLAENAKIKMENARLQRITDNAEPVKATCFLDDQTQAELNSKRLYEAIVWKNAPFLWTWTQNQPILLQREGQTYKIVTFNPTKRLASAKIAEKEYESLNLSEQEVEYLHKVCYARIIADQQDQLPEEIPTIEPHPETAMLQRIIYEQEQRNHSFYIENANLAIAVATLREKRQRTATRLNQLRQVQRQAVATLELQSFAIKTSEAAIPVFEQQYTKALRIIARLWQQRKNARSHIEQIKEGATDNEQKIQETTTTYGSTTHTGNVSTTSTSLSGDASEIQQDPTLPRPDQRSEGSSLEPRRDYPITAKTYNELRNFATTTQTRLARSLESDKWTQGARELLTTSLNCIQALMTAYSKTAQQLDIVDKLESNPKIKPAQEKFIRHVINATKYGKHHDQDGRTRINLNSIAERMNMSPATAQRGIQFCEEQLPELFNVASYKEEAPNGEETKRYYASIIPEALPKLDKIEPLEFKKQGGDHYICPFCGSKHVKIRKKTVRTIVCDECHKESKPIDNEPIIGYEYPNESYTAKDAALHSKKGMQNEAIIITNNETATCSEEKITSDPPFVASDPIEAAAKLLLEVAGEHERHIIMPHHHGNKYLEVKRSLTLNDLIDHFNADKEAKGAPCSYRNGQTRALCADGDEAGDWAAIVQAAEKLKEHGFVPLLEKSPARGGHLWVIFDALVDVVAARAVVYQIAPELAKVPEQWPTAKGAEGNRVRLPGGYYYRKDGVKGWCQLTNVVTGEVSVDGAGAAALLLSGLTKASVLDQFPTHENDEKVQQAPASFQEKRLDLSVNSVNQKAISESREAYFQEIEQKLGFSVPRVDERWEKDHGKIEKTTLYFAVMPGYTAKCYNLEHSMDEIHPRERNGMALSPNGAERTASTTYRETEDGERYTDFSTHGKRPDGTHDSGDVLELAAKVQGVQKKQIMSMTASQFAKETTAKLEAIARDGQPIPQWMDDIITPAGRRQYKRWLEEGKNGRERGGARTVNRLGEGSGNVSASSGCSRDISKQSGGDHRRSEADNTGAANGISGPLGGVQTASGQDRNTNIISQSTQREDEGVQARSSSGGGTQRRTGREDVTARTVNQTTSSQIDRTEQDYPEAARASQEERGDDQRANGTDTTTQTGSSASTKVAQEAKRNLKPWEIWGKMEEHDIVCQAIIPLNKSGMPARKSEPVVSQRKCGSTAWQWSEERQERVCSVCWASQP